MKKVKDYLTVYDVNYTLKGKVKDSIIKFNSNVLGSSSEEVRIGIMKRYDEDLISIESVTPLVMIDEISDSGFDVVEFTSIDENEDRRKKKCCIS